MKSEKEQLEKSKRASAVLKTQAKSEKALLSIVIGNLPRFDIMGLYIDNIRKKLQELLEEVAGDENKGVCLCHTTVILKLLDNIESELEETTNLTRNEV